MRVCFLWYEADKWVAVCMMVLFGICCETAINGSSLLAGTASLFWVYLVLLCSVSARRYKVVACWQAWLRFFSTVGIVCAFCKMVAYITSYLTGYYLLFVLIGVVLVIRWSVLRDCFKWCFLGGICHEFGFTLLRYTSCGSSLWAGTVRGLQMILSWWCTLRVVL